MIKIENKHMIGLIDPVICFKYVIINQAEKKHWQEISSLVTLSSFVLL